MAFLQKKDNNVYMGIGVEIRRLRKALGMSQAELARKASVEVRHISRLENEMHSPTADLMTRIADALGVSPRELWPAPSPSTPHRPETTRQGNGEGPANRAAEEGESFDAGREPGPEWVPIVGHVSGGESENLWGDGDFPVGEGFDQLPKPPDLFDTNAFGLEVRGDSMAPVFRNGAVVVVSPNREVNSGDFAVVRTREGKSFFKMVWIEGNQVRLTSINPAEPPMVYQKQEVRWIYPVVWAKLRR
jgi:phage repressor protein C with HTH and peptisase S24 domain